VDPTHRRCQYRFTLKLTSALPERLSPAQPQRAIARDIERIRLPWPTFPWLCGWTSWRGRWTSGRCSAGGLAGAAPAAPGALWIRVNAPVTRCATPSAYADRPLVPEPASVRWCLRQVDSARGWARVFPAGGPCCGLCLWPRSHMTIRRQCVSGRIDRPSSAAGARTGVLPARKHQKAGKLLNARLGLLARHMASSQSR
jgi:hypothetical protein